MLKRGHSAYRALFVRYNAESKAQLEKLRNIGISAHIDSGKTTVTERILYYTGRIDEMHEVRGKDGVGAVMDSMELERQRGITIQSAATFVNWKGTDINIIDTPGHVDFTVEVERSLRVLDGAALIVCASGGVQSQTLTVFRQMKRYNVPFVVFINKLDRTGANPEKCINQMRKKLGINTAFMYYNIGLEKEFEALIDIVQNEVIYFHGDNGEDIRREPVPEEFAELRQEKFDELVGCLADVDDEIGELFLMEEVPTNDQLYDAIRRCTVARSFQPILMGSALKNKGVQLLLDACVRFLPQPDQIENFANQAVPEDLDEEKEALIMSPERSKANPPVMLAFKLEKSKFGQLTYMRMYQGYMKKGQTLVNTRTGKPVKISRLVKMHASDMIDVNEVYAGDIFATFGVDCASGDTFTVNELKHLSMESIHVPKGVVSMSIKPSNKKATQNFLKALVRFANEDPSFTWVFDQESGEYHMTGMGELHLEIYAQRMEREYDCPVEVGQPKVAFRETILPGVVHFDYQHKRQSGGRGQYGRAIGKANINPKSNTENVFNDKLTGTNLSRGYVKPLITGMEEVFAAGPQIGEPVVGISLDIIDGAEHRVDSSEISFQLCGQGCAEQILSRANKAVIEPIMNVEVVYPQEFDDRVNKYLYEKHADIQEFELDNQYKTVYCQVPLNDMFGFTAGLRGCTEGKGEFSMDFSHYDLARDDVIEELAAKYQHKLASESSKKK